MCFEVEKKLHAHSHCPEMRCLRVSDRNLVFELIANGITEPQGYFELKNISVIRFAARLQEQL